MVGLGARFALRGDLSAGQFVAFYGYATFLVLPAAHATDFANQLMRGLVAARRVIQVLALEPDITDPVQPVRCRTEATWSTRIRHRWSATASSPRSSRPRPSTDASSRTGSAGTPTPARCGSAA